MPDPVTHLSIGYVVSRHLFKDHKILFLCSCMVPDIDGLAGLLYIFFFLPEDSPREEIRRVFELFHPSIPASIFFLPFFVLIVVWAFRLLTPKIVPRQFSKTYLLVLTGVLLHLGLDMLMTGNRPFWPLPFEAGLGVIPYSIWGVLVPMAVGITLVMFDLLISHFRKKDKPHYPFSK